MMKINQGWRGAGLLLHPSSLPSPYGIGDLGPSAHEMVAFIRTAGLHFWQFLPLGPTSPGLGNSPYSSFSAFAGNAILISPDLMVRDGWLKESEAKQAQVQATNEINFHQVTETKASLFDMAFQRAEATLENHSSFQDFIWKNGTWLNDYALFMAAKQHLNHQAWVSWPQALAKRDEAALKEYGTRLARPILKEKFIQFIFSSQLAELKSIMEEAQLELIGDVAIYVNHDSADVWSAPHLFDLNSEGMPTAVAGVPPDYFSQDGQLWGNPLFKWEAHRHSDFDWWKHRLWHMFKAFHWVRLDHFRAFAAFWSVPAGHKTAAGGQWVTGPGADLFNAVEQFGPVKVIAEDLGVITPDVTDLRRRYNYPGMRILQFAFGPTLGSNLHTPFRIEADNVVYPGTHDNNTTRGWYRQEATAQVRRQLSDLAGYQVNEDNAADALVRLAWLSPGAVAVASMQDILNLDEKARLNTPGTASGNWGWKMLTMDQLSSKLAENLAELGVLAGRDNRDYPNIQSYNT